MERRKISIETLNKISLFDFEIAKFDEDDDSLTIRAHRGEPRYLGAEITFRGTEYITCPTYFFDVFLRKGTEQEISSILHNAVTLFCFEETMPCAGEEIQRFFIEARDVEIIAYHGGDNLDNVLGHQS